MARVSPGFATTISGKKSCTGSSSAPHCASQETAKSSHSDWRKWDEFLRPAFFAACFTSLPLRSYYRFTGRGPALQTSSCTQGRAPYGRVFGHSSSSVSPS